VRAGLPAVLENQSPVVGGLRKIEKDTMAFWVGILNAGHDYRNPKPAENRECGGGRGSWDIQIQGLLCSDDHPDLDLIQTGINAGNPSADARVR
jgi:hypothetical protein